MKCFLEKNIWLLFKFSDFKHLKIYNLKNEKVRYYINKKIGTVKLKDISQLTH